MKNVKDRVDFYSKWHSTGIIPQSIDSSLVTNIRGLLNAYGNEIALQRKSTTNVLSYEFHIGNNCNESSSGLLITWAALVVANLDSSHSKLIAPNTKTVSVSKLPQILCTLVKTDTKSVHVFSCPVFKDQQTKEEAINCADTWVVHSVYSRDEECSWCPVVDLVLWNHVRCSSLPAAHSICCSTHSRLSWYRRLSAWCFPSMHFLIFQQLTHTFDHRVISEPLLKLIEDYDVDADTKLYSIP